MLHRLRSVASCTRCQINGSAGALARHVLPDSDPVDDLLQPGVTGLDIDVEQSLVHLAVVSAPADNPVKFGEDVPDRRQLQEEEAATVPDRKVAGPDPYRCPGRQPAFPLYCHPRQYMLPLLLMTEATLLSIGSPVRENV